MGESWSLPIVGYRYIYRGRAGRIAAAPANGRQKLGLLAKGVSWSSWVQQDLSWVCR